jgi:hypothetical protein
MIIGATQDFLTGMNREIKRSTEWVQNFRIWIEGRLSL